MDDLVFRPAGVAGEPDDVAALLAVYAARRLSPRLGALGRIRGEVLAVAATRPPAAISPRRPPVSARQSQLGRRLAAVGLAASLTVAGAATVLASGPESPLYAARIWLEGVTLPARGPDRSEAHRQHLEARLHEAQAAARGGDPSAVAAALAAYRSEVEAALADVGDDPVQLARLEAALATHLVVLDALADRVPPQAADSIRAAMSASDRAVSKIKERKSPPGRPAGEPPRGRP